MKSSVRFRFLVRARKWLRQRNRELLPLLFPDNAPVDLRIVGRTLFHAALVGVGCGLIGAAFFGGLEYMQHFLLERLVGYVPLRAAGEGVAGESHASSFHPWLLIILPALGGLLCGYITRFAAESRGGGGDATIDAFHHKGGTIRRRNLWVKPLASLATLGTGGSGGREGPTMHMGGALGSLVGRVLHVSPRERRILLVAGVGAGLSAVFRTPLGAALLAVEFLYRDGFESDALVPSVLASVVSYSVVISIYGESTLFSHAARFPFHPSQLLYYGIMALLVATFAAAFAGALRRSHRLFKALPVPAWLRPALGGLLFGLVCTPIIMRVGADIHQEGQGLGLVGGGYGAVQMAISGVKWLPEGWRGVELLLLLAVAKLVTSSLTIGSEGSAGDFAPSMAIGGLVGGAFGRALQIMLHDPTIDPGAFALVGMGVFYGGIAHVPLSALVLVCELAGNYDLLVPLMLAQGIAYVALRRKTLYGAQVPTQRESPVHRDALMLDMLQAVRVKELMIEGKPYIRFAPHTPAEEMLRQLGETDWQDVFPVVDGNDKMVGLVASAGLNVLSAEHADTSWALAADIMQPAVWVHPDDDLRTATERLLGNGLRELPVVDSELRIIGFVDEAEVSKVYIRAAARAEKEVTGTGS